MSSSSWSMRDAIRLAHPPAPTVGHSAIYNWLCGRDRPDDGSVPEILDAHALAHNPDRGPAVLRARRGIADGLPREALPTEAMQDPDVWRDLLPGLGLTALLRNLSNLTASGVLAPGTAECARVAARLLNRVVLHLARVHPFAVLLAALVYRQGHGVRGSKTWLPVPQVLSALEDAYDLAFANAEPTNRRMLVGIDISGSMTATCAGTPIRCALAARALAITLARMEPHAVVVTFDTAVQEVMPVTRRTGIASIGLAHGGGTDLSAPVRWAMGQRTGEQMVPTRWGVMVAYTPDTQLSARLMEVDAFIIITDNETWAGRQHPAQALDQYRRTVNRQAQLVCCSLAATAGDIVDPGDLGSMGCAGLDASLPALVADFIRRGA